MVPDLNHKKSVDDEAKLKKALKKSEFDYKRLFDSMRDGMLILADETGLVIDANDFLSDLLGYSKKELLGKRIWELGFLKDMVENKAKFQELLKKGHVQYENLPLKTKKGEQIDAEFNSNVYVFGDKKLVQCIIRDITKRRKAEEELKENEELFRTIFEKSSDGILVMGVKTKKFILANQKMCEITGYSKEELLKKRLMIFILKRTWLT